MKDNTDDYIKLLKELNDARLDVIKIQDDMIKELREVITLKDTIIKLKNL